MVKRNQRRLPSLYDAPFGQRAPSISIPQKHANRYGDRRHLAELVHFCRTHHLHGHVFSLEQILVEPRFYALLPLVDVPEEDTDPDVFEIIPRNHIHPYLHAAYNLPTLGVNDLSKGNRHLAILGLPGSGRTTALAAIALWSLALVEFDPPYDKIQAEIDRRESELSKEERTERIRHRIRVAQKAQQRMAQSDGRSYKIGEDPEVNQIESIKPFRERLPIYLHLDNLDIQTDNRQSDPAEPLIRAVQLQHTYLTSKTLPTSLYRAISRQQAIVLIDCLDEQSGDRQNIIKSWLDALMRLYPDNYYILTALPMGFHWMTEMGITPVYLRPWSLIEASQAVQKHITTSQLEVDENNLAQLQRTSRALLPVEIALRTQSFIRRDGQLPENRSDWIIDYLNSRLDDAEAWRPLLERMAQIKLDSNEVTLRQLIASDKEQPIWTPFGITTKPLDTAKPLNAESTNASPEVAAEGSSENTETSPNEGVPDSRRDTTRSLRRALSYLEQAGVIIGGASGRYRFRQSQIAAYLGGMSLVDQDEDVLVERALKPSWHEAFGYTSEHRSIDSAVSACLTAPLDIQYSTISQMVRWLSYAGKRAGWRPQLLRLLGNLVVAPHQYVALREHIAAALISSQDEGALVIMRTALQNQNADIRTLGCLGLGALRDTAAIKPLAALLKHADNDVQVSATLALGAIGTQPALLAMVEAMQHSESRSVRRAAAEMLAMYPDVGYETLYDAINEVEDILLRRAILFGLGRVRTDWALITINEVVSSAEEEFYVRLAAMEVFRMIYEAENQGVHNYPELAGVPWLLDFAEQQRRLGELPRDATALDVLQYAMTKGHPQLRYLALVTSSQLGIKDVLDAIYVRLNDKHEAIRDSAYRSLMSLSRQFGISLPAPVKVNADADPASDTMFESA